MIVAATISPAQRLRNAALLLNSYFADRSPASLRIAAITALSAARVSLDHSTARSLTQQTFDESLAAVSNVQQRALENSDVAIGLFYKAIARIRTVALHPVDANRDNTRVNALQHCYWAALLGASIDEQTAWQLLEDHELGLNNYNSRQDRANNRVGLAIGIPFRETIVWGDRLWDACVQAADDGRLFHLPDNPLAVDDIRGDVSPTRIPVSRPTPAPAPNPGGPERPERPDPISPDPITPDPITPDPITPDPITPDPITPDPITPDPADQDNPPGPGTPIT